ncbi:hypothetical protein TNCV_1541031 [Trichonephila clavipes]|nr:hypothetical protein TNCV_1541031 [Trichonephila clavipes]
MNGRISRAQVPRQTRGNGHGLVVCGSRAMHVHFVKVQSPLIGMLEKFGERVPAQVSYLEHDLILRFNITPISLALLYKNQRHLMGPLKSGMSDFIPSINYFNSTKKARMEVTTTEFIGVSKRTPLTLRFRHTWSFRPAGVESSRWRCTAIGLGAMSDERPRNILGVHE